jgi:hypothetical protein
MSAGKNHPGHGRCLNAGVTSAAARPEVPYGGGRSPGAPPCVGAAPGCLAIGPPDTGAEAQGAGAR